ncbi:glutaminyl-peptide cyclotransferase [Anaerolineales bacterium]
MRNIKVLLLLLIFSVVSILTGAQDMEPSYQILIAVPVETYPHDENAFTQGLVVEGDFFYESTGRYGESSLRKVEIETGEVLQSLALSDTVFAEGLALVDDTLIQITWKAGEAYYYDKETFELKETFTYEGEGWGICYDGEFLFMSNGSNLISVRDPQSFEELQTIEINLGTQPVMNINELECIGDYIFANIWQTEAIIIINKLTGSVDSVIFAQDFYTEKDDPIHRDPGAVLNGIAFDVENDLLYLTGKNWDQVFQVNLVEYKAREE